MTVKNGTLEPARLRIAKMLADVLEPLAAAGKPARGDG